MEDAVSREGPRGQPGTQKAPGAAENVQSSAGCLEGRAAGDDDDGDDDDDDGEVCDGQAAQGLPMPGGRARALRAGAGCRHPILHAGQEERQLPGGPPGRRAEPFAFLHAVPAVV